MVGSNKWKKSLSVMDSPFNKGVTMRAIFSNPTGWKFIDSFGW